jgi:hypothetical protein
LRDPRREARLRRIVDSAIEDGARRLEGLLKQPGGPGYDANAEKPPEEWGPRARTAVLLAAASPTGRHALERVLQRWPSVQKMLPRAGKGSRKIVKLHEPTDSAGAAKHS